MALDFDIIKVDDPDKIVLVDSSDGVVGDLIVSIEIPNRGTPLEIHLEQNKVNTFYDVDLNTPEEEELPDGVYNFGLRDTGSHLKTERSFVKTARLQGDMDRVYVKLLADGKIDDVFVSKLTDIEMNLESSGAHLRSGDPLKAKYFFDRAKHKVEDLVKTC